MIRPPNTLQELIFFFHIHTHSILWLQQPEDSTHWSSCISQESFRLGAAGATRSRVDVSIRNHRFCLTGRSDQDVAQSVALLGSLPGELGNETLYLHSPNSIHYPSNGFDFDWNAIASPLTLKSLLHGNRRLAFLHVQLPEQLAVQLASQSSPVDLMLYDSSFTDDGNSFLQALRQRNTPFGTLTLNGCSSLKTTFLQPLYQLKHWEALRIVTYARTACTNNLLPFAADAEKVEYEMVVLGDEWKEIDSITIVPRRFVLKLTKDCFGFPSVFLRASTQLIELGIVTTYAMTEETQLHLIQAVQRNPVLETLELGPVEWHWSLSLWQVLMDAIRCHDTLTRLKLYFRSSFDGGNQVFDDWRRIDVLVSMIKMNRNLINVNVVSEQREEWMDDLEKLIQFNRFCQGSRWIARENEHHRICLLCRAMMEVLHEDDRKSLSLLLLDHLDVICVLLQA
ncbi:hypothetical protein FisN_27Lh106 [Fistulifera solaris]|uniref:Uncharacterized protein n=1 Tax=Fistulifera solaris TaxID=1519565 RepID=A0A1Z5KAZ7_FISSO|nr:hypothetical protein FisN_27Lh106 [Fistulifera solaris]|eukprot:GAX23332.1 hypothetical protein FisN_27Lh106 [Fistulifera solaris]